MTATLTIMGGLPDQAGQVFEVGSGTTTLGRGLNCDIQLADQNLSRSTRNSSGKRMCSFWFTRVR